MDATKRGGLGQSRHLLQGLCGHDGLLYRLVIDLSVPVDGADLTGTISMDFSNFGAPVSVTAPPAGDVTPYQTFLAKY